MTAGQNLTGRYWCSRYILSLHQERNVTAAKVLTKVQQLYPWIVPVVLRFETDT
jgi:hypothetical protein